MIPVKGLNLWVNAATVVYPSNNAVVVFWSTELKSNPFWYVVFCLVILLEI